jgi:hypothetical protein
MVSVRKASPVPSQLAQSLPPQLRPSGFAHAVDPSLHPFSPVPNHAIVAACAPEYTVMKTAASVTSVITKFFHRMLSPPIGMETGDTDPRLSLKTQFEDLTPNPWFNFDEDRLGIGISERLPDHHTMLPGRHEDLLNRCSWRVPECANSPISHEYAEVLVYRPTMLVSHVQSNALELSRIDDDLDLCFLEWLYYYAQRLE